MPTAEIKTKMTIPTGFRVVDCHQEYDGCDDDIVTLGRLDNLGSAHPLAVNSWEDFYGKLGEAEEDETAGRVYTTEEVFSGLKRKILTGQWDDD